MWHHLIPGLAVSLVFAGFTYADTVRGKAFRVDPTARTFELLKETEYDPKTDLGQSRFRCAWSERTTMRAISEKTSFDGIRGPVWVQFRGLDPENRRAVAERKAFVARVATVYEGMEDARKPFITENEVGGWFAPGEGTKVRSGVMDLDGTKVGVTLRERNARIFHHAVMGPEQFARGSWQVELEAEAKDGFLQVDRIEAVAVPDPRLEDDPKLPRMLVIGDSISMNYHDAAKKALKGVVNYHRNEGNAFSSAHGVNNTELWLGDFTSPGLQWNVIQFNHGLHDLKQTYDAASDQWGAYAVPLDQYQANLEKQIAILRKTGARLIWCTTTPVPNDNKGTYARRKGASAEFNAAALEVVRRHPDILITDLHAVVDGSAAFDSWRKGSDVHFYQEQEQNLLGEAVAATVRMALPDFGKKLPAPGKVFPVAGCPAFLIEPPNPDRPGPKPWVWYAPTLRNLPAKEESWLIQQFLDHGIAVAGIDVGESMGSPAGRGKFTSLYLELTKKRGYAPKPCLLARSRGGLMLYNWAAEHPDCVAAIAGIYPVGNLASWPGLGKASSAYGLTPEHMGQVLVSHNPVDRLAPLAKAGVPILHLHGDNDKIVPLEKHSGLLHERYKALSGNMRLVVVPGGGHDMQDHWFRNQELVDFVIRALGRYED